MPLSSTQLRRLAGVYGAIGIACGAFGAHGLSARQPALAPRTLKAWESASYWLVLHAVALLGLSSHAGIGRFGWRLLHTRTDSAA